MDERPRLLDLFCGAGGAGMGYSRAGFEVVGVDIRPQKNYPFEFHQGDALEYVREHGQEFDAIHASPPCQAHTSLKTMHNARRHVDLVPATRIALRALGLPYVIENVVGAPLRDPVVLCGTMFGLGVADAELRRHRLFEMSFPVLTPPCRHRSSRTIGIYGEGCRDSRRKFDKAIPEFTVEHGRRVMETPWMTLAELCQAIPPAYTAFIGAGLLEEVRAWKTCA
jgi:DNA (cytosine-5)-methyltransferase 1